MLLISHCRASLRLLRDSCLGAGEEGRWGGGGGVPSLRVGLIAAVLGSVSHQQEFV